MSDSLLRWVVNHQTCERRHIMSILKRLFGGKESLKANSAESELTATGRQATGLVRYRGLTFNVDGEYSLVCDEKKIVRGIWYRDRDSIKNAARNRMVVAHAENSGFTVLDSDYEMTIVGGIGGVEDLNNPGGAILWFASTRELFGQ